jgi:predicted RNA-binding protein with PIN domain
MTYYLDAYNLIHCSKPLSGLAQKSIAAARDLLIKVLADYCAASNDAVVAVFDGQADPSTLARYPDQLGSLRIVYCDDVMSADTYIGRAVYQANNRLSLVVVSADRAVAQSARGMGALVLTPQSFMDRMGPVVSASRSEKRGKGAGRFGTALSERLSEEGRVALRSLRDAVAARDSGSGKDAGVRKRKARR